MNLQNPFLSSNTPLMKRLEQVGSRSQKSEIQKVIVRKFFKGVFNRLRMNDLHTEDLGAIHTDVQKMINAVC
jgi:hypothetical protein